MPDNPNLPKPNIPNPNPPKSDDAGSSLPQTPSAPSAPSQPLSSTQSPASASQQSLNSSRPTAQAPASKPAGLDPQSPGGALPDLNEQGQVTRTSTISQTPQEKQFDQRPDLPVSKMQQLQQRGEVGAGRTGKLPGKSLAEGSITPQQSAEDQQKAAIPVGSHQAIQAVQTADSAQKPSATVSHPNLKANIPPVSGVGKVGQPTTPESSSAKKSSPQKPDLKSKTQAQLGAKPAAAKKPILKYLFFGLVGLLVVGGVVFGIMRFLGGAEPAPTTDQPSDPGAVPRAEGVVLTYWGLWEPESVMQSVFDDFQEQTGIMVDYRQQSPQDYRTHLQSAIVAGSGPDVFRFHATWVPMFREELAPLPSRIMSVAEYEQTFYPIFSQQLQHNGQLVGIPLMYDGLGLYYNVDILRTANEEVPETWAELRALATRLTVRSGNVIERGGLAIGNAENVEHFSDILGLLIFQNGGNPAQPLTSEVRDAIQFYVSFAKTNPVFSTALPSSTTAFARGEVAMMIAPSWRTFDIQHINPELNFDIAPAPKLSESDLGWASYWAEGVNSKSAHKDEAWQLLKYLSSPDVLRKLYSEQSQIRAFGESYPRQDMASDLAGSKYVEAYLLDAPVSTSWYMCTRIHDEGINDQIIDYYKDAVNSALTGTLSESHLQTLSQGVNQTLRQYGLQQQ